MLFCRLPTFLSEKKLLQAQMSAGDSPEVGCSTFAGFFYLSDRHAAKSQSKSHFHVFRPWRHGSEG